MTSLFRSILLLGFVGIASKLSALPAPSREIVLLSNGWRFNQGDVADAQAPGFADGTWAMVQVPHTWNRVGYYLRDPRMHVNRVEDINKVEGPAWYRLSFVAPKGAAGRKAWLEFDAASRTAEVWLNGMKLGQHRGGFSRFRFDASSVIIPGRTNVLAVRVDNTKPTIGSPTADVLPLQGDFFVRGGLYRPVRLIFTNPVHIDMMDHGGPGVYARTLSIGKGHASVEVRSRVANDAARPVHVSVVTKLLGTMHEVAVVNTRSLTLGAGAKEVPVTILNVARPHLWQGTNDPYLYTMRVELRSAQGQLLDSLDQAFGIRQIRLDPENGLVLNGRQLPLHGVGLHQDLEGKDWALSEPDIAQTMAIIREMGANTIRLTHYEHGQIIHDFADRLGLILWDEIPLVTAWTVARGQREATPALVTNAQQQLQEVIRQNFNHPSVAVWGIANEVDFGPGRPDYAGRPPAIVPDPIALLRRLNALAKSEDPDRPTASANCCEDRGMPNVPITAAIPAAAGVNRYFGWYYGKPADLGPHLDHLHAKRPNQPLAVSEYGAGGAVTIHTDDPLGGPIEMGGRVQPEEYQSWVHEQTWPILKARHYLWATWLWNAFDFASTVRSEGDSQDLNTKGLVTFDRKIRKDAFYYYKANWSSTPTVHINGRRYAERAYPVTDVRVYSNAPTTDLMLNSVLVGQKARCSNHVCVWPNVRLGVGTNRVIAIGHFGAHAVKDSVDWHVAPEVAGSFRIDSGSIVAARSQSGHFGSDAFFEGGRAAIVDRRQGGRAIAATIEGSADRDLLASYRTGNFSYHVPTGKGRYEVTLSFIEPDAGRHRAFNVLANGRVVLGSFDVLSCARGAFKLCRRTFDVDVEQQFLELHFKPLTGEALVSAVEVVPSL